MYPHLVNRPRRRTIMVPSVLMLPQQPMSTQLRIAEKEFQQLVSRAPGSNDASISRVIEIDQEIYNNIIANEFPRLQDELSPYATRASNISIDLIYKKTEKELSSLEKIELIGEKGVFEGRSEFQELLSGIHRLVCGGDGALRSRTIGITPDEHGNCTIFPTADRVEGLLCALSKFIKENRENYPGLCAVVAYTGIIHAHPFPDANGRTARVLFNFLIRSLLNTNHFVPITKLMILSNGGFLIKLRRALLGGEWEPLMLFFVDALKLSCHFQHPKLSFQNI